MNGSFSQSEVESENSQGRKIPLEKHVFQTIFLDKSLESSKFWTKGDIDPEKVGSRHISQCHSFEWLDFTGNPRKMVEATESQMATLCWDRALDGFDQRTGKPVLSSFDWMNHHVVESYPVCGRMDDFEYARVICVWSPKPSHLTQICTKLALFRVSQQRISWEHRMSLHCVWRTAYWDVATRSYPFSDRPECKRLFALCLAANHMTRMVRETPLFQDVITNSEVDRERKIVLVLSIEETVVSLQLDLASANSE